MFVQNRGRAMPAPTTGESPVIIRRGRSTTRQISKRRDEPPFSAQVPRNESQRFGESGGPGHPAPTTGESPVIIRRGRSATRQISKRRDEPPFSAQVPRNESQRFGESGGPGDPAPTMFPDKSIGIETCPYGEYFRRPAVGVRLCGRVELAARPPNGQKLRGTSSRGVTCSRQPKPVA